MSNVLKLYVPIVTDATLFLVKDVSFWDCDVTTINIILEVKVPGDDCFTRFLVDKEFFNAYNCSHFNLCCLGCDQPYSDLPDGVWEMKYSFNPNVHTMSYFKHLRVTQLYLKYISAICNLEKNKCDLTKREIKEQEQKLFTIKNKIDHAKWMVEECGDEHKGLSLYGEAKDQLQNFGNCGC